MTKSPCAGTAPFDSSAIIILKTRMQGGGRVLNGRPGEANLNAMAQRREDAR
jgi:hypothetical protein